MASYATKVIKRFVEGKRNMVKIKLNHILSAIAAILAVLCFFSIYSPVRFGRKKAEREAAVKARLMEIRRAEEAFRKANGVYAGSFSQLAGAGLLADSMRYVPYGEGAEFELSVTISRGQSGSMTPLMECGAPYESYLNGLDENLIRELTEKADEKGEYPGLRIGDTTTPNDNAGNWE